MEDKIDIFLHILIKTIPEIKNNISISINKNYEYGLLKNETELILKLPNESVDLYSKVRTIFDFCDIMIEYQEFTFETMEFRGLII